MSLDTKWLEDFLTLAETRSFSRAAKERHITQPAFGRHIRALEEYVGQELIDRSTIPVSLTSEGVQFRLIARNIISQINEGVDLLNGLQKNRLQPICISTPHTFASPVLLDLIDTVKPEKLAPGFKVDVQRIDAAVDAMFDSNCDFLLAVDILSLLQPPFENLCIGQGDYLLVSVADDTGKALHNPDEGSVPYLNYSSESYSARLLNQYPLLQSQVLTHSVFESSMCQLQKDMALRGKGLAWLPDCLIRDELQEGVLIPIKPNICRAPYQIRLYRNSTPMEKHGEAFWQQIKQKMTTGWRLVEPWCSE